MWIDHLLYYPQQLHVFLYIRIENYQFQTLSLWKVHTLCVKMQGCRINSGRGRRMIFHGLRPYASKLYCHIAICGWPEIPIEQNWQIFNYFYGLTKLLKSERHQEELGKTLSNSTSAELVIRSILFVVLEVEFDIIEIIKNEWLSPYFTWTIQNEGQNLKKRDNWHIWSIFFGGRGKRIFWGGRQERNWAWMHENFDFSRPKLA